MVDSELRIRKVKKELRKIFEFIVKHRKETIPWTNNQVRRFIKWAWFYKRLLIIRDELKNGSTRIAAIAIVWRSPKPDTSLEDLSIEATEYGDYLYAFEVIVHPDYEGMGLLFQLLSMALWRFPGIKWVYWDSHSRKNQKCVIIKVEKLMRRLAYGKKEKISSIYSAN